MHITDDDPSLRTSPATLALVGLCVGYFGIELWSVAQLADDPTAALLESYWILDPKHLVAVGALDLTRLWFENEWWRLATTSLMHGSLIHLALNMSALISIGPWVERVWGSRGLIGVFCLSALAGALASAAWVEARFVVGASAGILGLAALLWIGRVWGPDDIRRKLEPILASRLGWMLGAIILLGFFIPAIAQAGHLGGFVAGVLCGLVACNRHYRIPVTLGAIAMAAIILEASVNPSPRPNYPLFCGLRWIESEDIDRALPYFEDALEQQPDDPILQNLVAYQFALLGVELVRAEELVKRALAQDPESPDFLDTLGWIWCRQGKVEEGRVEIGKARDLLDEPNEEIEEHWATCAEVGPR